MTAEERCIYCGEIIPEGRIICVNCENTTTKMGAILQSNEATKEEVENAFKLMQEENNINKEKEQMKRTLIVIDMQNDFIDGALGTKEAQAIVPNVKKKIEEYEARGDEIVFTRDTHYDDYLETNEGQHLPVKHCIYATEGWEIHKELNFEGCLVLDKGTFGYAYWDEWLDRDTEEIEIIGLCTDICVVSNVLILKAIFPEANITVDTSCCAGVTPESHKAALTTMKMCQINVIGE